MKSNVKKYFTDDDCRKLWKSYLVWSSQVVIITTLAVTFMKFILRLQFNTYSGIASYIFAAIALGEHDIPRRWSQESPAEKLKPRLQKVISILALLCGLLALTEGS